MKFLSFLITLIIGIAFGVGVAVYAPDLVRKYLPADMGGSLRNIEGTVVAKEKKDKELLVTINTDEGAMLSTFRKNLDKIDLLVDVDDIIEIKISGYRPFIDDPIIARVKKPGREVKSVKSPEESPEVKETPAPAKEAPLTEPQPEVKESPEISGEPAPAEDMESRPEAVSPEEPLQPDTTKDSATEGNK